MMPSASSITNLSSTSFDIKADAGPQAAENLVLDEDVAEAGAGNIFDVGVEYHGVQDAHAFQFAPEQIAEAVILELGNMYFPFATSLDL